MSTDNPTDFSYSTVILPVDHDHHGDILHEVSSHTVFLSCISHRFPIQEMYHIIIRPLPTTCRLTVHNFLLALLFKRIDDSSFTRFCIQYTQLLGGKSSPKKSPLSCMGGVGAGGGVVHGIVGSIDTLAVEREGCLIIGSDSQQVECQKDDQAMSTAV